MKILLTDIGNTTCDIRFYDTGTKEFIKLIRPLTQDVITGRVSLQSLMNPFENQYDAFLYVSVVPEAETFIKKLGKTLNLPTFNVRHHCFINKEKYKTDNLDELGSDFIANFNGYLSSYHQKNAVIVSLGTATTTLTIHEEYFIGTTISPGLRFSLDALLKNAALLKEMDYRTTDLALATNSFEAINIGTINGHYYMIQGIITKIAETYSIDEVIFTGGNSTYYPKLCSKDNIIIDDALIFKGLIHLYKPELL